MLRVSIPNTVIADPPRVARTYSDILEKLAAIPGVSAAAFASSLPLEGFNSNDPVVAEDKVYDPGQIPPLRRFKFVSPGYFRTVGTPLVTGRDLTWTDVFDERPVAVVSENMAREMWGEPAAALGKRIRVAPTDAVARNRRRGRRCLRQRRPRAGADHRLLADADGEVLGQSARSSRAR